MIKSLSWLRRNGVPISTIAGLAIVAALVIRAVTTPKEPVNTQAKQSEASKKVEFTSRCVNGKQALIVQAFDPFRAKEQNRGIYMLWDIDMAGRPIQCGEVAEVGPR